MRFKLFKIIFSTRAQDLHIAGHSTIQNAKDSDITLIISRKWNSPGTILTMNACTKQLKPFTALREDGSVYLIQGLPSLKINASDVSKVQDADDMDMLERPLDEIAKALLEYRTINVAGNAENNAPGIENQSFNLFYDIFSRMKKLLSL